MSIFKPAVIPANEIKPNTKIGGKPIPDILATLSMKNNMVSPLEIEYWRRRLFVNGTHSDEQIRTYLDNILSSTTVKRACCLDGSDRKKVNVRIPIPKNLSIEGLPQINKDFGFIDKVVEVPAGMCENLPTSHGSNTYSKPDKTNPNYNKPCDDFFDVYCANMLALYNEEHKSLNPNSAPNYDKFVNEYKPECACYNPNSISAIDKLPYGPRCLMYPKCTNANNDNGLVYLDPMSRDKCPDNLTICNQIIDLSNVSAGGNIIVSPELNNTCGGGLNPSSSSTTINTEGTKTSSINTEETKSTSSTTTQIDKNINDGNNTTNIAETKQNNIFTYAIIGIIILMILCICSSSSYFMYIKNN